MKLIIFDFDGVIANTEEIAYKIHTIKNKNLTWKHFQEYSMGNFWDGYEKAVEEGKHIPADDFPGSYRKGLDSLTVHDVLHDSILSLATDYKLVIISSTRSPYINDFLKKEGLLKCFSDILGADIHKNKSFKIQKVLKEYGLKSSEAVFITDTLGDIKEANECGVKSIAVTWGLHDRLILEKGEPFKIIDDPKDLIKTIKAI